MSIEVLIFETCQIILIVQIMLNSNVYSYVCHTAFLIQSIPADLYQCLVYRIITLIWMPYSFGSSDRRYGEYGPHPMDVIDFNSEPIDASSTESTLLEVCEVGTEYIEIAREFLNLIPFYFKSLKVVADGHKANSVWLLFVKKILDDRFISNGSSKFAIQSSLVFWLYLDALIC